MRINILKKMVVDVLNRLTCTDAGVNPAFLFQAFYNFDH